MFGSKEAKLLCDKVLKRCGSAAADIAFFANNSALTRFANNAIHQNVFEHDVELVVRYIINKSKGTASTNRLDDAGLDEVVERAKINAQASAEDVNFPGLAEPASYAAVDCFDPLTAECTPEGRARAVGAVCRLAKEKNLNASGAFSTGFGEVVIANSQGLFGYHITTQADFQSVVMGPDASGRAHGSAWRVGDIAVELLGSQAIEKTVRGQNPRLVEPGEWTVVVEPYVTEDLVMMLNFTGMGAQSVQEGRSWMSERIGKQAMSQSISIWDDALDTAGIPIPFDFEGVPKQRVDIVKEGVVMGAVYDRYTAAKEGKVSTGHGLPPNAAGFGPIAINLFMAAGDATLEEMTRSTKRGLYVSRFWYTRPVHPRDCVVTGMTRDGVFMIEDGEITYPVKNLRFTQSYVEALANVEMVSKETHLLGGEFGGITLRVPALKISRFNFTGVTV